MSAPLCVFVMPDGTQCGFAEHVVCHARGPWSHAFVSPVPADDWQPMTSAPTSKSTWVIGKLSDGREVRMHFAQDLSGSEQPSFQGWFKQAGSGFFEVTPVAWKPEPAPVSPSATPRSWTCDLCGNTHVPMSIHDPRAHEDDGKPKLHGVGYCVPAPSATPRAPDTLDALIAEIEELSRLDLPLAGSIALDALPFLRELAERRADGERLDWLERVLHPLPWGGVYAVIEADGNSAMRLTVQPSSGDAPFINEVGPDIRAAIDASRSPSTETSNAG